MNPDGDIRDLVLGFFNLIDSKIVENHGIYRISIPEKYNNFFQKDEILITFDSKSSLEYGCELVIPGSKTLSLVMRYCSKRGPIVLKRSSIGENHMVFRWHFFVNFSGVKNISEMAHVDIDSDTLKPTHIVGTLEGNIVQDDWVSSTNITKSYSTALDELKKRCNDSQIKFLDDANKAFLMDYEIFVKKYESQIRDLDDSINRRESNFEDPAEVTRFRFDTLEQIKAFEGEMSNMAEILQEKHKIVISYDLIACEIIQS